MAQGIVKVLAGWQSCEVSIKEDPITSLLSGLPAGFSSSWTPG